MSASRSVVFLALALLVVSGCEPQQSSGSQDAGQDVPDTSQPSQDTGPLPQDTEQTSRDVLTSGNLQVTTPLDDESEGTLRWALTQSHLRPGEDIVTINIGVQGEIRVQSPLPSLKRGNVSLTGNGATLSGYGLKVESGSNHITNLRLTNIEGHAIHLTGLAAAQNTLEAIEIGEQQGSVTGDGIRIDEGAHENTVQGTSVVGCLGAAIRLSGEGVVNNRVAGSLIGLRPSGAMVANGVGIVIESGASENQLGDESDDPTQVGGSLAEGILVSGSATTANLLQHLYIGLRPSGARVANQVGIHITAGATRNIVRDIVVAGNVEAGIKLSGNGTTLNEIAGGYVGLRPSGALVDPNQRVGILLQGAVGNKIGHEGIELRVSASELGMHIEAGSDNEIAHTTVSANAVHGIKLDTNATANQITYNQISENLSAGIYLAQLQGANIISRNSIWGNGTGISSEEEHYDDTLAEFWMAAGVDCGGEYVPPPETDPNASAVVIVSNVSLDAEVELYWDPSCGPGQYQGQAFLDAKKPDSAGTVEFMVLEYPQATSAHLTYLIVKPDTGTTPFMPVAGGECPPAP